MCLYFNIIFTYFNLHNSYIYTITKHIFNSNEQLWIITKIKKQPSFNIKENIKNNNLCVNNIKGYEINS